MVLEPVAGQVLVYRGHLPGGCYVLLRGELALDPGAAVAAGCGVVVPPPAELDLPAARTLRAGAADCRLLFVPRSLALHDARARRLLSRIPSAPLAEIRPAAAGRARSE